MIKLLIIMIVTVYIVNGPVFAQPVCADDSVSIIYLPDLFCKRPIAVLLPLKAESKQITSTAVNYIPFKTTSPSFLDLHGNIFYSYNYTGTVDTPYAQNDVSLHTTQIYLTGVIRQKYPFKIYLTNRISNSNFLPSPTDISFQFNPRQFNTEIKRSIKTELNRLSKHRDELLYMENSYHQKLNELKKLKGELAAYASLQKQVEQREREAQSLINSRKAETRLKSRLIYDSLKKTTALQQDCSRDSLLKLPNIRVPQIFGKKSNNVFDYNSQKKQSRFIDTSLQIYQDSVAEKFKKESGMLGVDALDNYDAILATEKVKKLEKEIIDLKYKYEQRVDKYNIDTSSMVSFLDSSFSTAKLKQKLSALSLDDSVLPKGYRFWYAIKNFSLGRINIDYSELSAKNISITGMALEYHPSFYLAIATGVIDYRFRDYIVKDRNVGKTQYLNIMRIGTLQQGSNSLIVTFYQGRRQLYNALSTTATGTANYNLHGFTIEKKIAVGRHSFIQAEIAKSSLPYYEQNNKDKSMAAVLNFNDHSNEAYSLILRSFIPSTFTKINLGFKHTSSNFQSFSVFTSGASQTSYSAKVDQMFFKRKLLVSGSIKANDFSNPYIGKDYRSYNVFAGLQLTLRVKKWPVVSIGYFPNSQLTKTTNDKFIENNFYTLTANANYFYTQGKIAYNTSLVYSQFYNKAADSNFVYFNTKNLMLNQAFFINRLTLNGLFSLAKNNNYLIYTIGSTADYKFKGLAIGGGIKYNKQLTQNITKLGYSFNISTELKKIGVLTACFDRGFIVSENNSLSENNTAAITFYKTF